MPCQTRGRVAAASVGRGAAEGAWAGPRGPVLLLPKHRVLETLGEPELADTLGRDLDGLTGLRIAADPRLAVREHELAEAGQPELAVLPGLLAREREGLVEHPLDLLLGQPGLVREMREGCRLRHRLGHGGPPLERADRGAG